MNINENEEMNIENYITDNQISSNKKNIQSQSLVNLPIDESINRFQKSDLKVNQSNIELYQS